MYIFKCRCVYIHIHTYEIYVKELAYTIMGAGRSQIHRTGRLETLGEELTLRIHRQNFFLFREIFILLLKPFNGLDRHHHPAPHFMEAP